MKKLYRPLCFVAAVAAMSLTSCQKENFNPAGEGETVTITVHANVEEVANATKTHIEGTQVLWDENEEMKIIAFNNADPDNTGSESNSTEFTPSVDFTTATFKATVNESKNPDRIAGVYPADAAKGLGSVSGNEVNATSYKVELAAAQSATANSYDPAAYIMIARADNYPLENNEWTAYYKRATALNHMILSGITDDIKSVTITFPEGQQAAGRRYFNLATGEAGEIYYGQTNAVTVNYATPLKAGNGENDVWFTSWNVNVKTGEAITVRAESATKIYTKTLTATTDVALMENYLNIFPFDMTGAEVEDVELTKVSIAEFLAAEVSDNVWYELTGTIANLSNTEYGNFYLVDETGNVYVYGLTAEKVSSNDKSFSSLGLKEGDIVTLIGTRDEYEGDPQVGGPAYYVSHTEGSPIEPEIESISVADFNNKDVDPTVFYQLTGTVENITNDYYGNFDLTDQTGSVYVYGLSSTKGAGDKNVLSTLGIKEGDILTICGTRGEFKGTIQVMNAYYVSHEVAPYCNVSPNTIPVAADATSATFKVDANVEWNITSNNPAFTISPASGSEAAEVTVSFPANESDEEVTVILTVSSELGDKTVTISQASASASTVVLLNEDFTGLSGDNTSSTGANSSWSGNDNFPTVTRAYQAGDAVKLGTSSKVGSIESKPMTVPAGTTLTVAFDVKGWTEVEGDIEVTFNGETQTVSYSAVMSGSFESKSVSFVVNSETSSTVKFATTAKRAYLDNIVISYTK